MEDVSNRTKTNLHLLTTFCHNKKHKHDLAQEDQLCVAEISQSYTRLRRLLVVNGACLNPF